MLKKLPLRTLTLAAVFLACLGFLLTSVLGPRTISIDAKALPLEKVVRSFEEQGRITILTNVNLSKPVTLYLHKVPVPIALHKLAMAIGAEFRLGYIFAPTSRLLWQTAADWESGAFKGKWYQLRGLMVEAPKEHPRNARWDVKPEPGASLGDYLEQASIRTGLCFALHGDPATRIPSPLQSGTMDNALRRLARLSHMECRDYAMLIDLESVAQAEGLPRPGERPTPASLPEPAHLVEFMKSRMAETPPEQRAEAQERLGLMEKLLDSFKDLPPEERKERFFEEAPAPSGPGGGSKRPSGGPSMGGGGAGGGRSGGPGAKGGDAGGGGGSLERNQMNFQEAERHVEIMESEMTPTQRAEFFRTYVEKRSAP